jgi:hypothetical protein
MLTLEKLRTYRKFAGDIDGFARSHGRGDSSEITDDDWRLIDDLVGALHIIVSGKASPGFAAAVEQKLSEAAPDPQVRQELHQLAVATL